MNWPAIIAAIIAVETGGLNLPDEPGAVGPGQIHAAAVADLNRHYGTEYAHGDFTCETLTRWAIIHYPRTYGASTPEEVARIWNGGPRGMERAATLGYWQRVENLKRANAN